MDIWKPNELILFIAFVIPGFISLKTYELLFPSERLNSSRQIIDAIAYSCINYALLFYPIYYVEMHGVRENHQNLYALFYICVLLIAPVIWVIFLKCFRTRLWLQKYIPHPTSKPWDYVFGQRQCYWIVVMLRDGTKIGGKYSTGSFASSAPTKEQLYLEETWVINADGGFERKRTDSAGILILSNEIVSVELFNLEEAPKHD